MVLGFPTVTNQSMPEIENEAIRLTTALALSTPGLKVKDSNNRQGHHTIPIYMCGSVSGQQLAPLNTEVHWALHSALVSYSTFINKVYRGNFAGNTRIFSYSSKEPLQLLAQSPQGRAAVSKHLRLFYNLGWFELGEPYFEPIFESESIKYIGGNTSLPICVRQCFL